jgi:hypothetical protein
MLMEDRERTLVAVCEVLAVLDRFWEVSAVGDGDDPELDRVIAGPVLAAEHHLWDARFQLKHLINEEQEES